MTKQNRSAFHGLVDTMAEMGRMREHVLHGSEERTRATAWVPTTDILVDGDDLIVRCELSGVAREDLEVTLSGGTLWIWGELDRRDGEQDTSNFYVHERDTGPFRRSINLPPNVDSTDLKAVFEDGLLEITIGGLVAEENAEHIQIEARADSSTAVNVGRH